MKSFFLLLLPLFLLLSCNNNNNIRIHNQDNLKEKDSLAITRAFQSDPTAADSVYKSLIAGLKDITAFNYLDLHYAKALIQSGRLQAADSVISVATRRQNFDTASIANARFYNLKAALQAYSQNQEAAIGYYKKALMLFEQHEDTRSVASVNFNIANIFFSRMDYNAAYQYAASASRRFKELQDTVFYPYALALHAVSAINLGNQQEATDLALQAQELSQRYPNPLGKIMADYALAEIAMHNDNYPQAIALFQKLIPVAEQLRQIPVLMAAHTSLAKAFLESQNYAAAAAQGVTAIEIAHTFQYKDVLYALHRTIAQAYQHLGNDRASLEHMRLADTYFRDEFTSSDQRAMRELLVQYETEKKERLLREQQLIIQQKNAQMRNWLALGSVLAIAFSLILWQYRRMQRLRFSRLQQEKENAVLKASMHGEERERNRISRELHDGVAAMIGAARMGIQSVPFLEAGKQQEQLTKIDRILDNTHTDVRRIAHDLLPVTLQKEGLLAALQQFAHDINQSGALCLTLQADKEMGNYAPGAQTALMLYRIIQELVNNIIKHAGASTANINLQEGNGFINVDVQDNGKGFNGQVENQGLYSIRERLSALGGTFAIQPGPSGGTKASITLPV